MQRWRLAVLLAMAFLSCGDGGPCPFQATALFSDPQGNSNAGASCTDACATLPAVDRVVDGGACSFMALPDGGPGLSCTVLKSCG